MASHHETFPLFDLRLQRQDAVATIAVCGELDLATMPRLSAAVATQIADAEMLVIDLTAASFIDSAGLRALLEADRSAAGSGCRLVVLVSDGPVRRLLELCELDRQLAIVSSEPIPPSAAQPHVGLIPAMPPDGESTNEG